MNVRDVLLAAARILRKGWCKGSLARTFKGTVTNVDSPDAYRFCPLGAIRKACAGNHDLARKASAILEERLGEPAHWWNEFMRNGKECAYELEQIAHSLAP